MDQGPVDVPLPLEPDVLRTGGVDLDLTAVDSIELAALIRRAMVDSDDGADAVHELLGDVLLREGTCWPDTAAALPFVARLAGRGLPARRRLDLVLWLLYASDRWADSLICGGSVSAAPWSEDVHRVVGAELPALLAGWADSPPAVRYALAGLAALHPEPGAVVADQIVAMAAECVDTAQGAYLAIAAALVTGQSERALALADAILSWDEDIAPEWVQAPGVSAAQRAGHVLAEGMQHTAR